MTKLRSLVLVIAALFAGWWILDSAMEAQDDFPGSWVYRRLFLDGKSFVFEATVELAVNGQPITLRRAIKCQRYITSYEAGLPWLPRYGWEAEARSFGQGLSDGSAVLVATPTGCGSSDGRLQFDVAYDDHAAFSANDTYLPFIAWTPDKNDPSVLEAYVSAGYFLSDSPRVRIRRATLRPSSTRSEAESEDDLSWLDRGVRPYRKFRETDFYLSRYAISIPESIWKDVPSLANALPSISQPQILAGILDQQAQDLALENNIFARIWDGGGIPHGTSPPKLEDAKSASATKLVHHSFDTIHPLRLVDNEFVLSSREVGVMVFYRHADGASWLHGKQPDLLFKGSRFEGPESHQFSFYDPEDRTLYVVKSQAIRVPTKPNRTLKSHAIRPIGSEPLP